MRQYIAIFLASFFGWGDARGVSWDSKTETLILSREECDQLLIDAVPADDVAYQGGVDVDGNPVVSADVVGSPQLNLPEKVTLPIELKDLSDYFHVDQGPYVHDAEITDVDFNLKNGELTFNGKSMTNPMMEKVKKACGHRKGD